MADDGTSMNFNINKEFFKTTIINEWVFTSVQYGTFVNKMLSVDIPVETPKKEIKIKLGDLV